MVDNVEFISIREVLARVARHPLLQSIDLEAGVQYTLDFIGIVGLPEIYEDKLAKDVCIHDFRAELPCDLVRIEQVRREPFGIMLRSMSGNFNTADRKIISEHSFKTQNRILYVSFPEGSVSIAYKAIPVDEDGLPKIPANSVFLKALEDYIKVQLFTVLFDCGKIDPAVLMHAEKDYAWSVGRCQSRFKIPSVSEMQTITGMMHRLIPGRKEFEKGFKTLGDSEHYRRHQG